MKLRYLSFTLVSLLSFALVANTDWQDNAQRIWLLSNPYNLTTDYLGVNNPALRHYQLDTSLTTLDLVYNNQRERASTNFQKGDRYRNFTIKAKSQYILSTQSRIWGTASYSNKETKNVRWNNTSDLDILFPYVMADTLGGNMKSETYQFSGGYLYNFNSPYTLGLEIDYRADMAYRRNDPRPKNVVSDLNFKLGVSREISKKYHLGLGFNAGIYKQDNDVKFFSSLKQIPVYHITGIGMRAVRFDGTFLQTTYDGHSLGFNLAINSNDRLGWTSQLKYNRFQFKKIMDDLKNIPLQRLHEDKIEYQLNYRAKQWVITAEAKYNNRQGKEILYGSPTGNHYPKLDTKKGYRNQRREFALQGLYRAQWTQIDWVIEPQVRYFYDKATMPNPYQQIMSEKLLFGAQSSLNWLTTKGAITWFSNFYYTAVITDKYHLDEAVLKSPIYPVVRQEVTLFKKGEFNSTQTVRYDLPFLISGVSIYAEAQYTVRALQHYKPSHYIGVNLGIAF